MTEFTDFNFRIERHENFELDDSGNRTHEHYEFSLYWSPEELTPEMEEMFAFVPETQEICLVNRGDFWQVIQTISNHVGVSQDELNEGYQTMKRFIEGSKKLMEDRCNLL